MILAAGRGSRMGRLTQHTPKPLLRLNQKYLIEYAIHSLVKIGVQDIVINICYLHEQIIKALGDGAKYGARIHYSIEDHALETGGGIFKALPMLGDDPFIVLSCDVISNYALQHLPAQPEGLAHIVLVNNPAFHMSGDFSLQGQKVMIAAKKSLTYANIGIYRKEMFAGCLPGKFKLGELLKKAVHRGQVTGEHFQGFWYNLGTETELNQCTQEIMQVHFS
jgi:MurNAc alpha-1-phosphate uridylyltransferase